MCPEPVESMEPQRVDQECGEPDEQYPNTGSEYYPNSLHLQFMDAADSRSIGFHSPLMMPARICDAVLPFLYCWYE
jgi:hypothetical protein